MTFGLGLILAGLALIYWALPNTGGGSGSVSGIGGRSRGGTF